MPELPEVNTVMKGFRDSALHDKILDVQVLDDKILRNCSADTFVDLLIGRKFVHTYRRGKYFFATLNSDDSVLFHLGMTGDIHYYQEEYDAPKHERFSVKLASGLIIGYDDPRKFSRILHIPNIQDYLVEIGLGPDALEISKDNFAQLFAGRTTTLKSVLMNQKLIAGVGNLYADEICYQARIHPATVAKQLASKHIEKLYDCMQRILQLACDRDAYYKVYPEDWFWKWRNDDQEILQGKGRIQKMKIGGRTTYYIDGYQKLIE
ncbi:MAG: DNA-(apurinic or apyrimidinic site) lyase [Saprospiraceae bacterium]|nr:DNA-(apurinic or apyrimidinic site) lyase [Saprospiraceae bacterium]